MSKLNGSIVTWVETSCPFNSYKEIENGDPIPYHPGKKALLVYNWVEKVTALVAIPENDSLFDKDWWDIDSLVADWFGSEWSFKFWEWKEQ